jgi:thioredoxin-like negative regulator of GroEL
MEDWIPRRFVLGLAVLLVLVAGGPAARGEQADSPMVVKIHADWCGTCTRLEPTLEALEREVGSDARIVVLDVTDKEAVARSAAEAERLGIRAFFDSYKGRTGTVGVLTADGKPVSVMKGELDVSKYVAALEKAREAPAT